jgi:hypothetical protein
MAVTFGRLGNTARVRSAACLRKDGFGQVSFSIIAVVILVAATAAGAYLGKKELDGIAAERREESLRQMHDAIEGIVRELGLYAASKADQIVRGWSKHPINQSEISDEYSRGMAAYIASSFPRPEGSFNVSVKNWTGGLFLIEKKTLDVVPCDSTQASKMEIEGTSMDYQSLSSPSSEVLAETSASPYYVAVGNFTTLVSADLVELSRACSFERPVISALPFIESRLRAFESSASGEFSDLSGIVSYMLTTLGQVRLLEGYGVPMYSEGLNTSMIITEDDVFRAVALGLVFEQARLFRAVDPLFAEQALGLFPSSSSALTMLLTCKGKNLDPAELFLWFLGKSSLSVDPRMMVAQAVSGLSDQLVMKFLEYMGWLSLVDVADEALDRVTDTVESVMAYLTGEDRALQAVTSWMRKVLESTGALPESYSKMFSSDGDFYLDVPEKTYYVEDVWGNLYPVWVGNATITVDVPEYDVLESSVWKEFYPTYKEFQGSMRTLASDSVQRLAFVIADSASFDMDGVEIDLDDGESALDLLEFASGRVDLSLSPERIAEAGRGLPMFSAQFQLATKLCGFVDSLGPSIFGQELLTETYSNVASAVLATAKYPYIPDLGTSVQQQLQDIVEHDVQFDSSWGVAGATNLSFEQVGGAYVDRLEAVTMSSVRKLDDGFAGPMVDSIAAMIAYGSELVPSIEMAIEDQLRMAAKSLLAQSKLSGYKPSVYVDTAGEFEFWDGNLSVARSSGEVWNESLSVDVAGDLPEARTVPFDPEAGYTSLSSLIPTDSMLIQVRRPWQFDRSSGDYPNTHLTSVANMSAMPYSTQWTVSAVGLIDVSVRSKSSGLSGLLSEDECSSVRSIRIDLSLPVVLHSPWPLQGVAYNPTNTLLSDSIAAARKFCEMVWEKIEPVVGWLKDGAERIVQHVLRALDVVAQFATRMVKALANALQTIIETIQEYIQKFADSVLAKSVQFFVDIFGNVEFKMSLYGFTITVQTSIPDLIYRNSKDILRVFVQTDRFGPAITIGARIAKLADGRFDIVANGTLKTGDLTLDVVIDPLMQVLRRLVEVHVKCPSWALDITMPEVEPYEVAEVSTDQLPGVGAFLSNIPIPALGLSAAVKAGLRLKFSPPFPSDVVVNEFESNPPGEDSGKEWVELYNPLAEEKSLDGWMLGTVHGRSEVLTLSGSIMPGSLRVFEFPGVSIDNGYSDDPFNNGDAIILMAPSGETIDITPMMMDTANDVKSFQRSWDGGPRWVFSAHTKGDSNGVPILLASSDFIAKALFEAFKEAFLETKLSEVSASLDFLVLFGKRVLHNFIENLLSIVSEIIHEVTFFFEVLLCDATGSAGAGIRTSFVITGEAIVDLLRWLIQSFATFVVNLGRAHNPIAYPAFPKDFFSGLYLRFEIIFVVGAPKLLRALGSVRELDQRLTCGIVISPNIPALGRLVGRDWGKWSVEFGLRLEGIPRDYISSFMMKDIGDMVDLWVLKGRIYGL